MLGFRHVLLLYYLSPPPPHPSLPSFTSSCLLSPFYPLLSSLISTLPLSPLQSFSLPSPSFAPSPFPFCPSFPTPQRSCLLTFDVLRKLHLFLWPAPQSCDMFRDFWFSSWLFQIFRLCQNSFELNCNLLIS